MPIASFQYEKAGTGYGLAVYEYQKRAAPVGEDPGRPCHHKKDRPALPTPDGPEAEDKNDLKQF